MTITITTVTNPLPQNELERFLPTPRAVRAFEDMQTDVTETIPEAVEQIVDLTNELLAAPYIAWEASSTLENERVINAGAGIAIASGLSLVSISLTSTAVSAGSYGDASNIPSFTVDAYGRLTSAASFALNSDNVTEGAVNLFFTDARAQAAITAGAGIDVALGVVSLEDTAVTPGSYGSATAVPVITLDQQGRATAASTAAIPTLDSGLYTPTLTSVANVTSSTAYQAMWTRTGDMVTVSIRVDVTAAAGATVTSLGISLPIPSALANANECCGAMSAVSVIQAGGILGDVANDRATLQFVSADTSIRGMFGSFTYRII